MPKMKTGSNTLLGRMLRRFARFGIILLSVCIGVVVFVLLELVPGFCHTLLRDYGIVSALAAMYAAYQLFDRLNLIPDDPDKVVTLSLSEPPKDSKK